MTQYHYPHTPDNNQIYDGRILRPEQPVDHQPAAGAGSAAMAVAARSRPVEYEARNLLSSGGYHAFRFSGSKSPVNLIGLNTEDLLLVQVRRARRPPGSITEVNARFRMDMDSIRKIGGPRFCRKELWLYNLQEGWHYYEVFPGGVMELAEPWDG
jgi:hypothetical protein